ncbi:hypothetical protein [Olivibacter sp. CPCC 100613]|uniref:hypothetical protein n=1 Tax=Olivibacter sp. CPCC 100613 TaxID=3079931 RepID=UPI002FFD36E3
MSCRDDKVPNVSANQLYEGRGLLYFRYPVSGATYQMVFIPNGKKIENLAELASRDLAQGCYVWINNRNYLSEILSNRKEVYPTNYKDEPNLQWRALNYVNVYIKMRVDEKNINSVTDTLVFDKKEVHFKYFIPYGIELYSLAIIK